MIVRFELIDDEQLPDLERVLSQMFPTFAVQVRTYPTDIRE